MLIKFSATSKRFHSQIITHSSTPTVNPTTANMVCLACLLPLFLVPIVNLLPVIFDLIMAKVYVLFGWEYRKPERAPPACPIRPSAAKTATNCSVSGKEILGADPSPKSVGVDDGKQD